MIDGTKPLAVVGDAIVEAERARQTTLDIPLPRVGLGNRGTLAVLLPEEYRARYADGADVAIEPAPGGELIVAVSPVPPGRGGKRIHPSKPLPTRYEGRPFFAMQWRNSASKGAGAPFRITRAKAARTADDGTTLRITLPAARESCVSKPRGPRNFKAARASVQKIEARLEWRNTYGALADAVRAINRIKDELGGGLSFVVKPDGKLRAEVMQEFE